MLEDPLFWVLVLPGLLMGAYAQWRIKANVAKSSQVSTKDGITGAEVARRLLDSCGLQDVKVEATPGLLTDHYDPRLRLKIAARSSMDTPLRLGWLSVAITFCALKKGPLLGTIAGHQKGTHAVSLATAHFNQLALLRYQSPSFVIEGFSPLSPIHEFDRPALTGPIIAV